MNMEYPFYCETLKIFHATQSFMAHAVHAYSLINYFGFEYLEGSTVLFEYIGPSKWPASSPDLNPVDYSVWNELERVLHRRQSFKTLDDLKAALIEAWEQLPHDHIVNAINKFRQRCRDVLQAEGGHIEHFR